MRAHTAVVDGLPLRWVEEGRGVPATVFLHGLPTSPELWRHVLPRVPGQRLALEMVGYGESIPAGRGRDLSVAAQAGYARAFLDAAEVPRAVIVGHDLGGGVAQRLALEAPERVAGLLLIDAIAYDAWPGAIVRAARATTPLTLRLPVAAVRRVFGMLIGLGYADRAARREGAYVHWRPYAANGHDALAAQLVSLRTADTAAIAHRLGEIAAPSRVLWGARDPLLPVAVGRRLADDLHAPFMVLPRARHWLPEEHPQEVATALAALLGDLGEGPGGVSRSAS